jgi:hypothetical protein
MMDLVDEQDRFSSGRLKPVLGGGNHLPHLGDVAFDAAQPLELRVGHVGDDMRERCFAGAGRARQDHRRQAIRFDRAPEKFSRRENVLLPNELVERPRTHPGGEGSGSAHGFFCRLVSGLKQVLHQRKIRSATCRASAFFREDEPNLPD